MPMNTMFDTKREPSTGTKAPFGGDEGLGLSRRRITVSTSGVVPQFERLGIDANAMLAHAHEHDVRHEARAVDRHEGALRRRLAGPVAEPVARSA
jgi:hypothetical protein